MRVRNLMVKPSSARGNDMIKVRWFARISDGDGHFTLNTGSSEGTTGKTEFDILANQDINIGASQYNANIDRVTKLPDCRLCLALKATALVDMTVNILTARQKDEKYWLPGKKCEFAMAAGRTSILSDEVSHVQGMRDSFSVRLVLANVQPQGTDVLHVNDMTLVTGEEKEIMDLLNVGAFTALTAPYAAVPDGGGVFLLALVILIGGWRHEGAELCSQTDGQDHLVKTNRHGRMGHPWIRQVDAGGGIHPQMRRDTGRAARQYPNRMGCVNVPGIATDRRQHLQQGLQSAARDFRDPVRHVDHDAPARHTGTGGCDHTCHRPGLFRRRHRTLLNDGLGVAA